MPREEYCTEIQSALNAFRLDGEVAAYSRYGNGHINDTFLVQCQAGSNSRRYILQRINHEVLTEPEKLMANI